MTVEVLTVETIPAYLASRADLAGLVDLSSVTVQEVGDGNLNLVFIVTDAAGASLVVKQSLPYVRMVGESWPLSQDRILAEARGYDAATRFSPDTIPTYFGLHEERRVIVLEDLSAGTVWRRALNEGRISRGAAAVIGRHVARVAFGTSPFGLDSADYLRALAVSPNPELERITLDLVFTDPYRDHPDNAWNPAIDAEVLGLREPALLDEVAALKLRFQTGAEALVHGDLHTGSVFVPAEGDAHAAPAKIFDLEFAFAGPVGFDLGAFFGNVLLAQARAAVLDRPAEFQEWLGSLVAEAWDAFEAELRALWPTRVDAAFTDGFLEQWLRRTWTDAIGFGGLKAIRRIVGLAKASDIESLDEAQHVAAARWVLGTARAIVEGREAVADREALAALVGSRLAELRAGA